MSEQVEVDINARDNGTPAWKKQADAVHAYLRELARIDDAQKKNTQSAAGWEKAIAGAGNRITAQIQGYLSLTSVVSQLVQLQKEQVAAAEAAADKDDARIRKIRVQAGLSELEGSKAQKSVYTIAENRAVTLDQASEAATQLISSGVSTKDATGKGLDEFLKVLTASNQGGKEADATGLAKALVAYIDSQGLEKNAENIAKQGQQTQRLFKGTNLQLTDLPALANEGAAMKGYLTPEEQKASFAALVDSKTSGSTAAVGLRNFASSLTGAGGDKGKTAALKKLGLKPGDVDFVGENQEQVLDRLAGGYDALDPKKRAQTLQDLVGVEGAATARSLIEKRSKIKEYLALQNDTAGFEQDLAIGEGGRNKTQTRLQTETEVMDAAEGEERGQIENTRLAYQNVLREKGTGFFRRIAKDIQYRALAQTGLTTPEDAVRMTANTNDDFGSNEDYVKAVNQKVERAKNPEAYDAKELKEFLEKNVKAVDGLTEQMAKPQKFTPRMNPAPAAPRPSAAIQ